MLLLIVPRRNAMDTTEICALTERALARMLAGRAGDPNGAKPGGRRKAPRWPFPGTVELWVPDQNGLEQHTLATSQNLSTHGIGIKVDEALPVDLELGIAIHEPEMSFHGRAVVRHCTEIEDGYYIGMQFRFSEQ